MPDFGVCVHNTKVVRSYGPVNRGSCKNRRSHTPANFSKRLEGEDDDDEGDASLDDDAMIAVLYANYESLSLSLALFFFFFSNTKS